MARSVDFKLVRCQHWRPRRHYSCGGYCSQCNSIIFSCWCSGLGYRGFYRLLTHEFFHKIFCDWYDCVACTKFDKLPDRFQTALGV